MAEILRVTFPTSQWRKIIAKPNSGGTNPKPAPIHGALVVEVQSGTGTFQQDPADPLLLRITAEVPGVSEYRVRGDVDMGGGQKFIDALIVATVTSPMPEAAALGLEDYGYEPKAER